MTLAWAFALRLWTAESEAIEHLRAVESLAHHRAARCAATAERLVVRASLSPRAEPNRQTRTWA